jgi:hypothetical protein
MNVGQVSRSGRWRLALVAGLVTMLASATVVAAAPGVTDSAALRDLARVRAATAKFHDVNVALAAGYSATSYCVAVPGLGVMGMHYVNGALVGAPGVNLAAPEMLLYVDTASGPRLVGVEYMTIDDDQDLATDADRPYLFGRGFDGPMPGHGPGQPVHYDLHVWVWQGNPAGVFAEFNPKVKCGP